MEEEDKEETINDKAEIPIFHFEQWAQHNSLSTSTP